MISCSGPSWHTSAVVSQLRVLSPSGSGTTRPEGGRDPASRACMPAWAPLPVEARGRPESCPPLVSEGRTAAA